MKLLSTFPIRSLGWAAVVAAALLPVLGMAATPEKPADYASSARIVTPGASSHYHFSLPFAVYAGSQTRDLDDLRIFNADGEVVPHALVMPRRIAETEQRVESLSWFPLSDSRPESIQEDVLIERNAAGSVVSIKSGQAKSDAPAQGLLLDMKAFNWPLATLKIETRGGQAMQHFSIQTSDNLKNWNTVLDNGVLARLEHNGQQLVQNEVSLPQVKANYLKIVWARQESVPEVLSIKATFRQSQAGELPFLWSDEIRPQASEDGTLTYSWQNALPVEKVDVQLPQINMLTQVKLFSLTPPPTNEKANKGLVKGLLNPPEPTTKAQPAMLASALIYRLDNNGTETRATQIALGGYPINGFSLLAEKNTGTALDKTPPSVRIGFVPRQLVFLASGKGPYTLAWGKANDQANRLTMQMIAPQHQDEATLPGLAATLDEIRTATPLTQPEQTPQQKSDYRWLLWGILVVGVVLLLGMAWKLMKS